MTTGTRAATDQDAALLALLDAQRGRAFEIVSGLDDRQLVEPVLPSGWTPLGMIEHLGFAERHWFQGVALDLAPPPPSPGSPDPGGPFTTTRSPDAVFAFYREQIRRANVLLATTPLETPPRGRHEGAGPGQVPDLRAVVLHMIEETARHLGHLDAARELIDGRTGLGPDDL
ncbi:DUF664 domain-containing protein [Cellulomonas sp. PhB143]|uniref:mycothiol transferase n=1 Tax=Cellulomonas sp. PhB143 TaxID=2485186 RepID=UPI000FA4FA6B|nr:DUF664 domain-containing protein [Cellulomonas sp. PhB143]ROS73363.1 uncharacterized protein DUF664 [Cellulomonas sp. PhB143]